MIKAFDLSRFNDIIYFGTIILAVLFKSSMSTKETPTNRDAEIIQHLLKDD